MSSGYQEIGRLEYFNGAIQARIFVNPRRSFESELTFWPDHPQFVVLGRTKQPQHFHPYQCEYFNVLEGELGLELEGQKERILTSNDGEVCIPRWANHRINLPLRPEGEEIMEPRKTVVLISGEKTLLDFQMDMLFFENWYAYQDDVIRKGEQPNIIQILSMWDVGGTYLAPPWWLPFGKRLSVFFGIVVGRWLGGSLGYQPYFRKWSSNWELASARMANSWFQRFAAQTKQD